MTDFLSGLPSDATLESTTNPAVLRSSDSHDDIPIARSASQQQRNALILGRQQASVDVVLPHKSVSRQHAVLFYNGKGQLVLLVPNSNKSKTFVNETRIGETTTILHHGDAVRFGNVLRYTVHQQQQQQAATTKEGSDAGEISGEKKPNDLEKIAQAGQGLSGREKRKAEIEAMMASLDQAPAYEPAVPEAEPVEVEKKNTDAPMQQQSSQLTILAERHKIPIADCFDLNNGTTARCTAIAIDPAGSRFAVSTTQLALHMYDFGGMDQRRTTPFKTVYPEPGYCPVSLSYSPDRIAVATGSVQPAILNREGELHVQCARGDMYVQDMHHTIAHTAAVTGIQWHPLERNRFITSSLDGSVRWWDVGKGKKQFDKLTCEEVMVVKNKGGRKTAATAVALHPGGRAVCVGTSCGSLQLWSRTNRPDRSVFDNDNSVRSIAFSVNGTKLVCRYADGSLEVRTYPKLQLWAALQKVPAVHEQANAVFNADASIVCAGSSTEKEGGSLHFFPVKTEVKTQTVPPLLTLPMNAGITVVQWHPKINQIFVGCDNGDAMVFSDPRFSNKGAVKASSKAGKRVDELDELLRERATGSVGEIIAPLHRDNLNVRKKRKAKDAVDPAKEREPERPATGKHKAGGQVGANLTFQQFVADRRITESKKIAGKDPREALFQYKDGKKIVSRAYEGNESSLAEKTAEQEEEEANNRQG